MSSTEEWVYLTTRPTGDGGYLKGKVLSRKGKRIKVRVWSPKTGEEKEKWFDVQYTTRV